MDSNKDNRAARHRRHARVRLKVWGTASRPRLCVFRSPKHIYAQVIDDDKGHTLVSASTLDADLKGLRLGQKKSERAKAGQKKSERAKLVGALVARRALDRGISQVAFDRGGYLYHGRVKAVAEAVREVGLAF